jgi:hypothetical protein
MSYEATANPIQNIGNINPINNAKDLAKNTGEALTSAVGNLKQTTSEVFDSFRNNRYVSGTADFLESNSAIAKIAFLLLVLIAFTFVLRLATTIMQSYFSPSPNPILINGLKRGNQPIIINQHPKDSGSVTIMRSKNETGGIEFTWNTWLFIESLSPNGNYQHIFHKGYSSIGSDKISKLDNGPGLYIRKNPGNNGGELRVIMSSFENPKSADISIPNIPLQKWINVTIRVKHKNLDVYINNNIVHRHIFEGSPPKQNYGNVYITNQQGFDGLISNLRYFNRAITGVEVANIVKKGANLKAAGGDSMSINPPYLSMRWYLPKE